MKAWSWFLAVVAGLGVTLGGLFWDALIHSQEHGHMVAESLLNLSNPGHLVFSLGLALTTWAALAGFTVSWLRERPSATTRRKLSAPLVLWIALGVAGTLTLVALARTG